MDYNNNKKTYLYLIRENFLLISKLIKEGDDYHQPYNPEEDYILYIGKAKHLQVMSLIGSTAEHLCNVILMKRGNRVIKPNGHTIDFKDSIKLTLETNDEKYFKDLVDYRICDEEDLQEQGYFGFSLITPENCLWIIREMRNSYLHKADANFEQNGIIWYFVNYLIWIAKEEFKSENLFQDIKHIGKLLIKKDPIAEVS